MNLLGMRFRKIIVLVYSVGFFLSFQSVATGQNLEDGLVGYWKFDEINGVTVQDSSGNNRHGTLHNFNDPSANYVDGQVLTAINFDGVDDYLSIPHDEVIDFRRTLSVSLWVKYNDINFEWQPLVYKGAGTGNGERTYSLWSNGEHRNFHPTSADVLGQEDSATPENLLNVDIWYNLNMLIDRNNGTLKLYVDGSLEVDVPIRVADTVSDTNDLLFGWSHETAGYSYLDGMMDEIRLYDRVLSEDEVTLLYNSIADSDGDGLTNGEEDSLGTNFSLSDTDGDGLTDGEEVLGVRSYEYIGETMTWAEASSSAQARGGSLAVITSEEEQTMVAGLVNSSVWLGGSDSTSEGNWVWSNEESWTYSNWPTKAVFSYSGEDQTFTVPDGVTSLSVKIWGAGGGGAPPGGASNTGGAGGYTSGTLTVTPGEVLTLIVGQGGINHEGHPLDRNYRYGGGASGGTGTGHGEKAGSGGGRSAIRRGSEELATAGGGGGGGWNEDGGNAGGADGLPLQGSVSSTHAEGGSTNNSGIGPGGVGGSPGVHGTESGVAGVQYYGGYSEAINGGGNTEAGGGGGGFYGGGGGGNNTGGGGGSGYFGGLDSGSTEGSAQGTTYPPNTSDSDYPDGANPSVGSGGVGTGGSGSDPLGGNGLIVIQWSGSHPTFNEDADYLSMNSSGKWEASESADQMGFLIERLNQSDPLSTDTDGDGISDFQETYGYSAFEQIYGTISWSAAKTDAESRGGHLATIDNAVEQAAAAAAWDGSSHAWLGGQNVNPANTWTWITGESVTYSNWDTAGGQPNSSSQDLLFWTGNTEHGKWHDYASSVPSYMLETTLSTNTNPSLSDSDGDGFDDLQEITVGSDPNLLSSTPMEVGLVGYYQLNGNGDDSSGAGNDGVVIGAVSTSDRFGQSGQALAFDGVEDYVRVENDFGSTLTITSWAKISNLNKSYMLWCFGDQATGPDLFFYSGHLALNTWDSDGNPFVAYSPPINEWVHYSVVISPSLSTIYINGVNQGNADYRSPAGLFFHISMTKPASVAEYAWDGAIDDVRLYNRVLSSSEISSLYNYEAGLNMAPSDILLSSSGISENQGEGTVVGNLTATDPNDSDGTGSYTFSLVEGEGATDNALFEVFENNSLRSLTTFDFETQSTYSVRLQVMDSDNAGYEEVFPITIIDLDDTAPVITLTGDATVTHEGATAYTDGGATWTDTVDGSGSLSASGTVDVNTVGTYVLTYDYTDAAGNAAVQVSRTVNVVDTTIPTITLTGDATVTHEGATAYTDGGSNWADTLDGAGTVTADGTVDVNTVGSYVLTYDYTDAAGNAAVQVSRTVNVVDTTIPVITLIDDATITHEAATVYTDEGANWADTLDGTGTVTADGMVDVNMVGSYVLTYDYTDAADNAAVQVSRTVNVVDTTAPVITLTGDATITHEAATVYTDEGATWTDTLEGTGTVTASGTVDVNTVGIYTLTYDFTDAAGNAALQVSRTVHVVDTTIPVISLHGDHNVSHPVWTPYVDAGATAFDSLDGNLSSSVVSTSNVDEGIPGRYLITYNVQDREGNQAIELTREIHVYNQNPTAISLSNFTIDENLPVATEVGEFSTSDPDDLDNNKTYQYLIVGGTGHERFSLSSDGILTSAFVFDYEAENSFEISVRTQDVFGGIFDQNFTINVVDTFHPIVETNQVFDIGINTAFFSGDVLDEGALSGVFERGFLVSTAPEPFYGDWSAIQINVGNGSGAFEASTDSLKAGTIYYVAAYAMNSEGINYGSSKKFKTDLLEEPLFIANAKKVEGAEGWWESSWLGAFYEAEQNGWVLHADMGWLFLVPDTMKEGMWFWKEGLAWIWTDSATYPYFFSQNFNGWVFFFGSDENHTLFYDYQHQNWLQIKK